MDVKQPALLDVYQATTGHTVCSTQPVHILLLRKWLDNVYFCGDESSCHKLLQMCSKTARTSCSCFSLWGGHLPPYTDNAWRACMTAARQTTVCQLCFIYNNLRVPLTMSLIHEWFGFACCILHEGSFSRRIRHKSASIWCTAWTSAQRTTWKVIPPNRRAGWFFCLVLLHIFRSTVLSQPNKVGLKCPYVRTYVHPFTKSLFDFNEIWHVGRSRWVMHDSM